jgi:hypothetical protein
MRYVTAGFLLTLSTLLTTAPAQAAVLIHEYDFNGNLSDNFGGPSLVSQGGTVNSGNYSFTAGHGLSLDSALPNPGDYSIDIIFQFTDLSGFRKIIDTKDRTADRQLYDINSNLQFYPGVTSGSSVFTANTDAQLVLTRDGTTTQVTGYVGGLPVITFNDGAGTNGPANDAVFSGPNNRIWFFMDDLAFCGGCEVSGGNVSLIRIYNGALTAAEVAALGGKQPPSPIPEPAGLTLLGIGGAALAGVGAWRRRTKPAR